NLGDLFTSTGSAPPATQSISSLQALTNRSPGNAGAWMRLAEAHAAAGQTDQAIAAYESYLGLRPKDQTVLGVTASMLEQRSQATAQLAANAQYAVTWYSQLMVNPIAAKLGSSQSFPLQDNLAAPYASTYQTLSSEASADASRALGYRQTLVAIAPRNADARLAVAQDALSARNYAVALSALEVYLKLAPHASNVAQIHSVIRQLRVLVPVTPKKTH
ncbi:MAG TPA: tetratricopeptide repeat protein, partial [Gaiellales bacterium]|nr:tetratricopeptide repeat protein [Gaiellales bacterium]